MNMYNFSCSKIVFGLLAMAFVAVLSCGCSQKEEVKEEVVVVLPDPAAEVKEVVTKVADSISALRRRGEYGKVKTSMPEKFRSAEAAIDYMKESGDWDKYSVGVLPDIARQDIGYADKLLHSTYPYFVIADKGTMRVTLYDRYGVAQLRFPMACSRYFGSKHKFRDNRTPEGFFSAEGIYDSREWLYTDDDGVTSKAKGVYGPRFMRLKTPVTLSVGIHGTNAPGSPGLRCSHGCMRLLNKNAWELMKYTQKGMPIIVNPSSRDDAVNKEEGYKITMLRLGKSKDSYVPDVKLPGPKPEEPSAEEAEKSKEPEKTDVAVEEEKPETPVKDDEVEKPETEPAENI